MELTRGQAQAFADVLIRSDVYGWSIYDDLAERFPGIDWIGLCEPNAADPRERSRPAFIGPRLPDEAARVWDRNIKAHIEACKQELDKPSVLFADLP